MLNIVGDSKMLSLLDHLSKDEKLTSICKLFRSIEEKEKEKIREGKGISSQGLHHFHATNDIRYFENQKVQAIWLETMMKRGRLTLKEQDILYRHFGNRESIEEIADYYDHYCCDIEKLIEKALSKIRLVLYFEELLNPIMQCHEEEFRKAASFLTARQRRILSFYYYFGGNIELVAKQSFPYAVIYAALTDSFETVYREHLLDEQKCEEIADQNGYVFELNRDHMLRRKFRR